MDENPDQKLRAITGGKPKQVRMHGRAESEMRNAVLASPQLMAIAWTFLEARLNEPDVDADKWQLKIAFTWEAT